MLFITDTLHFGHQCSIWECARARALCITLWWKWKTGKIIHRAQQGRKKERLLRKSFIAKQYHQTQEKKPDKSITLVELAGLQQHPSWLWLDENCDPCWTHLTQSSSKFLLNSLLLLLFFFALFAWGKMSMFFHAWPINWKKSEWAKIYL